MTVTQLYAFLNEKIPPALSCAWDNDGLMCCPDGAREVTRVLVALDVTDAVVQQAILERYDVILSHHPLVFHPLKTLNGENHVARKLMLLIRHGIAVMSFHTRLDAVAGGVNDTLAQCLGLKQVVPFGEEGIGRMGTFEEEIPLQVFAMRVRQTLSAPSVQYSSACLPVRRVALLGGDGKDDVAAAKAAGADTFLTGDLRYDQMADAPECGMNLVTAGHFYTEEPVCRRLCELALEADAQLVVTTVHSNPVQTV